MTTIFNFLSHLLYPKEDGHIDFSEEKESLKSLIHNILSNHKNDEFGKHKMYTLLKKEYNFSSDKPISVIGEVLRNLWGDNKIIRRSSEKAGVLYRAKIITKSHKESYKFFDQYQILKQIKSKTNSLVMGAVQSGKTKFIISYAYQSLLKGISTVILVLPTNDNEYQIRSRFEDNREYIEYMKKMGLEPVSFPKPMCVTSNVDDLEDTLNSTTPGIIVSLCNPSKMKRIMDIISDMSECKFNLVIDEIDSFYKSKDERKFHEPFKFLIDNAQTVVGITATIFDVVLPTKSDFVTNKNMYLMDIPDDYKGFSDLNWIELEDPNIKENKISNDWIDSFYRNLLMKEPYILDDNTIHPIICLHKVDRTNDNQEHTQYYFKRVLPKFSSIVYNGKGVYIYYHKLLDYKSLTIDNKESPIDCGVFKFKLSISQILGWLRNNSLVEPPTHIIIISGKMADRGISFVSSDYKWHLTHELMIVPHSSTAGSLLQGVRICGRYKDDIPLHIITEKKVYDDCIKADNTQREIYDNTKNIIEEKTMSTCISDMSFSDEALTKGRRLATNKYKKLRLNIVPNDTGEYCLITPDMYGEYKKVFEEVVEFFKDGQVGEWILRSEVCSYLVDIKVSNRTNTGYRSMFENKKNNKIDDDTVSGIIMMKDIDENNKIRWWVKYNE